MLSLSKVLQTGKALEKLSKKAAVDAGFESGGHAKGSRGVYWETVTVGRVRVRLLSSWPGSGPRDEALTLSVDDVDINIDALDHDTRAALYEKLQIVFQPLFDTLEREKVEASRKKTATDEEAQLKRKQELDKNVALVRNWIDSLE